MKVEKCHVGKQEIDDSCELCINGKLATCQAEKMKEEDKIMSGAKQEPKEPSKINIPENEICPHCHRGTLIREKQPFKWQFMCSVCSRAWIVLDGKYWLAGFDTAGSIYEVMKDGQVIDRNSFRDDTFREELWNRVRK